MDVGVARMNWDANGRYDAGAYMRYAHLDENST